MQRNACMPAPCAMAHAVFTAAEVHISSVDENTGT